jgi:hypothetical protein
MRLEVWLICFRFGSYQVFPTLSKRTNTISVAGREPISRAIRLIS